MKDDFKVLLGREFAPQYGPVNVAINEVYLFHGTDFDPDSGGVWQLYQVLKDPACRTARTPNDS